MSRDPARRPERSRRGVGYAGRGLFVASFMRSPSHLGGGSGRWRAARCRRSLEPRAVPPLDQGYSVLRASADRP
jgi:hypothetical protein